MKTNMFAWSLILVSGLSSAATKIPFACEQIKEKVVRSSCIESREAESAEKAKIASADQATQSEAAEKNRILQEFVAKSKEALVRGYKDPSSVQFGSLVVSDKPKLGPEWRALCGTVNAKNSYGGYVGVKRFYVNWTGPGAPEVWNEGARTANWRGSRKAAEDIESAENELYKLTCEPSAVSVITPVG